MSSIDGRKTRRRKLPRICNECGVPLTVENTYKKVTALLCKEHYNIYSNNIHRNSGHKHRKKCELKNDKTPRRKKQFLETAKRMYEKYPEKWKARAITRYAVKTGKITKKPCEKCGDEKSQAHHSDYRKPLEVTWLCHKHHMEIHYLIK